jgi:hypothetical protein
MTGIVKFPVTIAYTNAVHQVIHREQENGFTSRTVRPSHLDRAFNQDCVNPERSTMKMTTSDRRSMSM